MKMSSNKEGQKTTLLTKKDMRQCFTRSCTLDSSWNYERMQNLAYAYMMAPVIRRLYSNKEDRAEALKRHLEFMSVTPHISTVLVGISAAMEEENAQNKEFDETSINAVKASLMGPLAGIGDSFFWGTLKIIAAGIGISLAQQGNILGPILFFLIINIPAFLARFFGLKFGYKYGVKLFTKFEENHLIAKVTHAASLVGLMVIGGMVASMIYFELPMMIGTGEFAEPLQGYINQIMPGLFPVVFFSIAYYLLGKKVKTTTMLLWLIGLSVLLSFFGIV
ncbi:PTS system mannose/fructose/sorbose family transporter subunit IID [Proteiniclasticum ruminis]|uniref:PTS system IID component, Man family n=1 Tax=Proteiniclasticum ruminis TaxID=398199 RepID=A0A1I5A2B0_9CLOT|nr:PTS system mannose/fructose/sorbose family transporter subunit IID [Proteiniclasticum ruminis]SFN56480.1 PTS system IID component, Man family [Proteiniclasticum ruminis]